MQPSSQQQGLRFLWLTATGQLLTINAIVFLAMVAESGRWFMPDDQTLVNFGAKSTYALIHGEYWRLITPMFVHVGVIHFVINSFALYYIGRYLEPVLGRLHFVTAYLVSGILGGAASAVLTFGDSAGASGAIFGIIGCGFVLERLYARRFFKSTGQRLRKGPFTGLVVINVILGFILTSGPVRIDNAAHLFGLAGGVLCCLSFLLARKNPYMIENKILSAVIASFLCVLILVFSYLGSSSDFTRQKILWASEQTFSEQLAFDALTEGIRALPDEKEFQFRRGRLLYLDEQTQLAFDDWEKLRNNADYEDDFVALMKELRALGEDQKARRLQSWTGIVELN